MSRNVPLTVSVKGGRFIDSRTGKPVVLRGFSYLRLNNPKGGKHTTFAPGAYDAAAAVKMLDALRKNGFNCVRVFVSSSHCRPGCLFPKETDTELSKSYMDNLADFLGKARERGIVVVLNFEFLPLNARYVGLAGKDPSRLRYVNRMYLDPGYIRARQKFMADFVGAVKSRGKELLRTVLAYDLHNEACFHIAYPFDQKAGRFVAPDGKTYDLAREKEKLADEAAVYWVNAMSDAIRCVDPDALTLQSVFPFRAVQRKGPGDFSAKPAAWTNRYPFRPTALARSKVDIISVHFYPKDEADFRAELKSVEFEKLKGEAARSGKALFTGEFGAFKTGGKAYKDAEAATAWIVRLQKLILDSGIGGCLHWQYDTHEQPALWNAMERDGTIFKALAAPWRRRKGAEKRAGRDR